MYANIYAYNATILC